MSGRDFARRMALGVGCCIITVALLLPLAFLWAPFRAAVSRVDWWVIPLLLLLGGGLLAREVVDYLRAEWWAHVDGEGS